jgi:NADH-quinone oxidoreductase subunit E
MLNEQEIREIRQELERYPTARAAVPEALRIVQRERGWISDDTIKDVAAVVGVSPHEVDSIATFYSGIYRRPVGRNIVSVCDSVSCWVTGCDELMRHVSDKLGIRPGQTTSDGRYTLLPAGCLGACDQGPAVMVNQDLHVNQTPQTLDALLEKYK